MANVYWYCKHCGVDNTPGWRGNGSAPATVWGYVEMNDDGSVNDHITDDYEPVYYGEVEWDGYVNEYCCHECGAEGMSATDIVFSLPQDCKGLVDEVSYEGGYQIVVYHEPGVTCTADHSIIEVPIVRYDESRAEYILDLLNQGHATSIEGTVDQEVTAAETVHPVRSGDGLVDLLREIT